MALSTRCRPPSAMFPAGKCLRRSADVLDRILGGVAWCIVISRACGFVMSLMMTFGVRTGRLRFLDACTLSMCASFRQSNRILSLIILPGIGP